MYSSSLFLEYLARLVLAGFLPPAQSESGSTLPSIGFVIPHFDHPEGAASSAAMALSAWDEIGGVEAPINPVVVVVDDG